MNNRKLKKVITSIIIILMIIQSLPISVFATSANIRERHITTTENDAPLPNIAAEVEDERTEFSKTYLLEDGSYHSITTYAPIHESINGEWENIDNSLEQSVDTVEDAQIMLQEASVEQYENEITQNSNISVASAISTDNFSSIVLNTTACEVGENGEISLQRGDALVTKLSEIKSFIDLNKLVVNATVNMNCTVSRQATIDLLTKTDNWNESTDLSNYAFSNEQILDRNECTASGLYSWNITDLFSQWDKENLANNGFILYVSSRTSDVSIGSLYIAVTYRDMDETETDVTYHTIDMGRAGTIYINDLTSTVKLEQDILKIPRSAMPIDLKRIYNLSDTFDSDTATGLRWNYESIIYLENGVASWETIDGTVKRFVKSEPVVTTNGYTQYSLKSNVQGSVEEAVLWVKTTELDKTEYDYSNFYIDSNNVKYLFDNSGRLIRMQIRNDPNNCLMFNYSGENLTNVSYTDAEVTSSITFNYLSNQIRVHFSTFNASSEETSYQEIVTIQKIPHSSDPLDDAYKLKVVYSDGKFVEYDYDYEMRLEKVYDENGSTVELVYKNYNTLKPGDRLTSYYKYDVITEMTMDMYLFDFETYTRWFLPSDGIDYEIIQYDKDFRIVSHTDANGNYTFISYDESGKMDSYVVSNDSMNTIYENGVESDGNIDDFFFSNSIREDFKLYSEFPSDHPIHNLADKGNQCLEVSITSLSDSYLYIETDNLEENKTYLVAANVFIQESNPNGCINLSVENAYSNDYFYSDFDYDVCGIGRWQYRLMAFKFNEADNALIALNFENQEGTFYIDNIALYEASPAAVGDFDNIAVTPFELQKNEDGSVSKEYISDGVTSLFNEYTYENNKISSVTDMQGVTTYYSYDPDTGFLNAIGNVKDENGNIVNPTELVTGINNLPTYIEQNVTNISTNESVEMTASYTYDVDERITSITSNGVTYNYEYTGDKLTGVSKNNTDVVDYEYTDGKIGSIVYNNGLTVNYVYGTNGLISEVSFFKNNTLVKKYVYTYNSDNKIDNVLETVSNMKTVYTANGFKLYSISQSNTIPLYEYVKNADESVSETYYPDVVSSKLDSYKDKVSVTKTTGKEEKYVDGLTGETTISSTQTIDKILTWSSETNFDETVYTLDKYTVNDYFGRISAKSTTIDNSANNVDIRISENYSYKELSPNTTSKLVSSHTSKIESINADNIATIVENDKRYYDYDALGNIVFEYRKNNSTVIPIAYYEYDEASQLVGEYNLCKNIAVTYTYDNGGNITSKIFHNATDVVVNNTTNKVENYGTVADTITYTYDVNSKDLLANFDGTAIAYDGYGNPLNYSGDRYETFTYKSANYSLGNYHHKFDVNGTCEWFGEYLSAFETEENRYTYEYDENGNRIKKTTLNKNDLGDFEVVKEFLYIWQGEQLSGFITKNYSKNSSGEIAIDSAQSEIIYDQMGEPIGFIFDDEFEWYFTKDLNGSVVGIVDYVGTEVASIFYDVWGTPSICFNADIDTTMGRVQYTLLSLTIMFNPIGYKGYLYDYETGLYFAKEKVYSPSWGRYLNCSYNDVKSNIDYSVSSINALAFSKNNPINEFDPYSYISAIRAEYFSDSTIASGLDIEMNKAFLSRVFCGVFANNLVKKYGSWEYRTGYTAYGMNAEYVATTLFARNIAKYKLSEMNAVNASWGDGWSTHNSLNNSVKVHVNDNNYEKYKMIWDAGNLILQQGAIAS